MALIETYHAEGAVVEIVRLQKEVMADGDLFQQEFAFMSDGTVLTRVTNQENESSGWMPAPKNWSSPKVLENLVVSQKAKGWTAIWHPAHDPALKEFFQFVPAAGLVNPEGPLFS